MKKIYIGLLIGIGFFSSSYDVASKLPAGVAGAPNESRCSQCHNSFNTDFNSSKYGVVFGNGTAIYENDSTYLIEVLLNGVPTKNYGFQAAIKDLNGNNIGSFTPLNGTTTVNSGYINHTNVNINKIYTKYSFYWKAPSKASFTDSLHFYMAGVIGNKANGDNGDSVITKDFAIYRKKDANLSALGSRATRSIFYNTPLQTMHVGADLLGKKYVVYNILGNSILSGAISNYTIEMPLQEGLYYFTVNKEITPFVVTR
jgi:hypothetical protein